MHRSIHTLVLACKVALVRPLFPVLNILPRVQQSCECRWYVKRFCNHLQLFIGSYHNLEIHVSKITNDPLLVKTNVLFSAFISSGTHWSICYHSVIVTLSSGALCCLRCHAFRSWKLLNCTMYLPFTMHLTETTAFCDLEDELSYWYPQWKLCQAYAGILMRKQQFLPFSYRFWSCIWESLF